MTLQPECYQFPEVVASGVRDWDANWLIIDGSVSAADGAAWRFAEPCLTTWEAARLSRWLRAVAAGEVVPTDVSRAPNDDRFAPEGVLAFTEPNVAFSLASRDQDQVALRVHLSAEARPPDTSPEAELFEWFVTVISTGTDLVAAADEWDRELAAFPAR